MAVNIRESIEVVSVKGSRMEIFLFEPEGVSPGIVLAQHLPVGHTGIENDEFTLTTARRLASQGFAVAVPFLFHWWDKSESMELKRTESRDDHMVADMEAAFMLLSSRDNVDENRIGIAGHCWGGRVAWLAACHQSACRALAVFYGGNVRKALGDGNTPPIELAQNIACPVIGFFGNDDQNPSPEDVDVYAQALEKAGVTYQFHRYDGAGHAFQNFPAEERYREDASEDAWLKVIAFLKTELDR